MKLFLRDVSLIVAVLVALALVVAAMGKSLTFTSYLAGGFVGVIAASARAYRRHLEAAERDRAHRRR